MLRQVLEHRESNNPLIAKPLALGIRGPGCGKRNPRSDHISVVKSP